MNTVFWLVADGLDGIAGLTGLTYNEVNILVFYFAIPLVYLALIDRGWGRHLLKVAWCVGWLLLCLVVPDFAAFCDAWFDLSANFLQSFQFLGVNYIVASVVICVVVPLLAFVALLPWAFPSLRVWQRASAPE